MVKELAKPGYWDVEKHFRELEEKVQTEYQIANQAKEKGLDPVNKVEIPLATSMAEKCVGLISTMYPILPIKDVTTRMLELEKQYGQLDTTVSFVIAKEIAEQKFCQFQDKLKAIDCGIRVGFAYLTLGVVASPLEGYTGFDVKKRKDGKEYWCCYFSGPIRSAGTTATCVILMLIDYLRQHFGYSTYDPSEEEVKRYVTEINDYHDRITNLQYLPSEEETTFLVKNMPIEIGGDPTESLEVSNYKDLERVPTNYIRGGMCLTLGEGLAQKAAKGLKRLSSPKKAGLACDGFNYLDEYLEIHAKSTKASGDGTPTYIKDLVAGRPVYGHPSRSGGFRFRYGRSRVSGFSSVSVHPATMEITGGFLSSGTQLKIEKPTKGCIITSCDTIEGPIVLLNDGSVLKIDSVEVARKVLKDIKEIIYLGDILFPLGDVIDRNHDLLLPGYVEEWWLLELEKKLNVTGEKINFDLEKVSLGVAIDLSKKYSVPLHPKFIYFWSEISIEEFYWLADWFRNLIWSGEGEERKLLLPWSRGVREKFAEAKRALELLGVPHKVVFDNIVFTPEESLTLLTNFGIDANSKIEDIKDFFTEISSKKEESGEYPLDIINESSKFKIKNKGGDFIGARMGRPEKAKLRKLTGSPNVLFSIGSEGGRLRSVGEAVNVGTVDTTWPNYVCDKCGSETIYNVCEKCGGKTNRKYYCRECGEFLDKPCEEHDGSKGSKRKKLDIKHFFRDAINKLGYSLSEVPPLIKGVRGTSNDHSDVEHLAKGIIRSKFNLAVNKDGTIRYDGTEIALTHFKPLEIGTPVEQLIKLGYEKDIYGEPLIEEDQILELKPHDVVLPACPVTNNEKADDVFFNIANFVDEELERLYHLPRYYNLKTKQDLVGQLVACMAPHNCAGVIGRIIGFGKLQGLVASPYMHAAMRRDCDGDEAAVMMLMDVLINFSRKFLPSHRGGTQDAPLVLNAKIQAGEVDDQILDFETSSNYPLELYELAEQRKHSSEVKMEKVKDRLREGICPFSGTGFTHDTKNFNDGVLNGAYKILPTMKDKVEKQMELVSKLRSVDTDDVARLIIERHFIRDIRGNLRKFCKQQFRCVACNEKFRRVPLTGVCSKCGGKIIFTITEGSIKKYLEPALNLAENYKISEYTKEGLELTKSYIESIFGKDNEKQEDLKKWF